MAIVDKTGDSVNTRAMKFPRVDDQAEVMRFAGQVVPWLLREAVDHGTYLHARSRRADPGGFADYGACTNANARYDRIAKTGRDLFDAATVDLPQVRWQIHSNQKSTEFMLDPFLAFRIKLVKPNRHDTPTNVQTVRQAERIGLPRRHRDCVGQSLIPGMLPNIPLDERVWITVGYGMDVLDEDIRGVWIGISEGRSWLWREELPQGDLDVLARTSIQSAEVIRDLRRQRTA